MTRCILQRRLAQRLCSCGPSDGGMVPAVSLRLQEISFRRASQHGHKLRGSKPSKEGFLRGGSILRCCRMQRMCSVKDPVTDIGPARPSVLRSGLSSPAWRRRIPWGRPQNPGGALEGGHRRGGPHRLPATPHAWAGISGAAEPALSGRAGARSGQSVGTPPPTDAPPTRARQGQRVKTTTRGRESGVGDRTDRPQKPEGLVSTS